MLYISTIPYVRNGIVTDKVEIFQKECDSWNTAQLLLTNYINSMKDLSSEIKLHLILKSKTEPIKDIPELP